MVVIRLARGGSKKRPFYHITVADKRRSRDGRFIERLGFFNPLARGGEERLRIDIERLEYWVRLGAQMSDRVKALHRDWRRAAKAAPAEPAPESPTPAPAGGDGTAYEGAEQAA